jgi:hypothetical protein
MPNINQQIVVAQQVNNRKMKTSSLDEQWEMINVTFV